MTLPPLITQMLSSDFYPHPVTEPIALIQTHISFVLLTGKYAYKVKKPMNFGFLDFSTLEKRHFFCQEELRLNRRLAPNLYLQVLAITTDQDRFKFAENPDNAVEYAIQMVQFPQENLLINLFEEGKLTLDHVRDIGKQLAEFHASAETNDHIASFGTAAGLKAVADDNYACTDKYLGLAQTQTQLDQTRAYTDQCFIDNADLFSDRIAQGKIRECHGDLHLKNICLFDQKVQIFDCIEFNEPFRNTDVLYDASFLLMDLQYRGRKDLANAFLNTYLELTNDYKGAVLLPLFCSMRAYIRAKVTSFLLDDPNIPESVKLQAQQEAAAYYTLAYQYTLLTVGKIFMMSGLSGSGKTTAARALAQKIEAIHLIHLRSDAIRKHLAGIDLMQRGDSELYTPEMTQRTYAELLNLGILLASKGFQVILDAKYDRQGLRSAVIEQAKAHNINLEIIYCTADVETLNQRLGDRIKANSDIADATPEILASQRFEEFTDAEKEYLAN
ncbi:hypothetical protein Syn7502_03367 [Synechococcus sp. PCC 7502]|uniref:bifunctional aminoglycoside phosphotransferase/ATP-binding protein n=1 Tax=Synechococcus sp. PCC 7502 TaxID=1173263 RepID=UPI00029FB4C4|nr:bifunctional aminoglycoside phosphotransferase/ATP-binding protein [Synechococcus sp. PCC 7502]AFY75221.1 hypothetical protein Syn7502_03367 [Synechococcus sp. PCC 7502]